MPEKEPDIAWATDSGESKVNGAGRAGARDVGETKIFFTYLSSSVQEYPSENAVFHLHLITFLNGYKFVDNTLLEGAQIL